MLRRYIFITIENFNRELPGKELLAKELSNKGFVVFLGHKSVIRSLLNLYPLKDHIFIDKGVTNGSSHRISEFKQSGMKVYSFDEEALMQTDIKTYSELNHELDSIKNIDGIFCWGQQHNEMLKLIGYKSNQLINTGNPRFDHYKYINLDEFSRNRKKYILICSRFCITRASEMLDYTPSFVEPTKKIYNQILDIPRFIRNSKINNPILIRPHPSENSDLWLKNIKGLKDVKISNEGPLKKVLKESILMIHNRCTTGIESYIAGVPVISFEPFELNEPPHPPQELINSFAHYKANSKKDILSSIEKILNGEAILKNSKNNNSKYLFFLNDFNYKKIAEFLENKYPPIHKNTSKVNIFKIIILITFIYSYHKFLKILLFFKNNKKFNYIKKKRGKFFRDFDIKKIHNNLLKFRFCSIDIYLKK